MYHFKEDDIDDAIAMNERKLETTTMSLADERRVIEQIKDMKKAKPLLPKYKELDLQYSENKKKMEEPRKQLKEVKGKLDIVAKERQQLYDQIADLTNIAQMQEKKMKEVESIEDKKIEGVEAEIEGKREERNKYRNQYIKERKEFEAQQDNILTVDWMKNKIVWLEKEEERRKEREEEEKEMAKYHKYQRELDTCAQLMAFCNSYFPGESKAQGSAMEEKVVKKEIDTNTQKKLETGELLIVEEKAEFTKEVVGRGKKKREKNNQKGKGGSQATKAKALNLQIDLGILSSFHAVQVPPPITLKDVTPTIELLVQRKAYYQELPAKELPKAPPKQEEKEVCVYIYNIYI